VPLLIGQSTNEMRVAQAESNQIVAAIRQANRPLEYIVHTDEGHGLARPENRLHFVATAGYTILLAQACGPSYT